VQQFWAAFPDMQYRAQEFLIRKGLLNEHLSLTEAVMRAPAGAVAVGTVLGAIAGVVGGLFVLTI
jgi:hypothetical protein